MGRAETARKGNKGQEEEPLVALDALGFAHSRNGIMDRSGSNLRSMPRLVGSSSPDLTTPIIIYSLDSIVNLLTARLHIAVFKLVETVRNNKGDAGGVIKRALVFRQKVLMKSPSYIVLIKLAYHAPKVETGTNKRSYTRKS